MHKNVDIKNRIVNYYNIDTGKYEEEIINYLDKQMKVRFYYASFWHFKYVFIGLPEDQESNSTSTSITVSSYRKREIDDQWGTILQ